MLLNQKRIDKQYKTKKAVWCQVIKLKDILNSLYLNPQFKTTVIFLVDPLHKQVKR